MSHVAIALIGAVVVPLLTAAAIFIAGESRPTLRSALNLGGAVLTVAAVSVCAISAWRGDAPVSVELRLLDVGLGLHADMLGTLFAAVASTLWLVTTVYAIGYMSHAADRARFFGFFAVCVGSALGVALARNPLTFFVFYEMLTLATYPLVVHTGTPAALKGGRTYLAYALPAGAALALGTVWLHAIAGPVPFAAGGSLPSGLVTTHGPQLIAIFGLMMLGLGVKAAIFPLHGWLPAAMVAPAPVSSLLHAVAVVKAGVFGIARFVLHVYGPDAQVLGVLGPLAALAAFTIIFGSLRALVQDDLKKRLAYSTIAQLSYIVLGVALASPLAVAGGLAHLAHHAVLKITMFFTAGVVAEEVKVYRVSGFDGLAARMPVTMAAFSVAALGIVGVPPVAGFATKWLLGGGAIAAGEWWVLGVLAASSLLNAAYFFPILHRSYFRSPAEAWVAADARRGAEADLRMVVPLVLTALAGLLMGVLAGATFSPSGWAMLVAAVGG